MTGFDIVAGGISRAGDYLACVEAGATAVAFSFHARGRPPVTPRQVEQLLDEVRAPKVEAPPAPPPDGGRTAGMLVQVRAFARCLPPGHPWRVGVFADPSPEEVRRTVEIARLTHVQIHGEGTAAAEAAAAALGCGLVHPIAVRGILNESDFLADQPPWAYRCDIAVFDERVNAPSYFRYDSIRPWVRRAPIWLAAALTPDNVRAVVANLPGLAGCEVDAGVERPAGIKDAALLKRFVAEALGGAEEAARSPAGLRPVTRPVPLVDPDN